MSGQEASSSQVNSDNIPKCAKCGKPDIFTADGDDNHNDDDNGPPSILKPCLACKSVSYCSRDCKKADGKRHKKVCAAAAQEYAKTAPPTRMAATRAPGKSETHRGGLQKWQFDT